MRLPSGLRFGLAGVWALMTLLSVPTLADGVAGWATWLEFVGSTTASYVFPTLGVLGLAVFTSLEIAESRARKRGQATPGVLSDIEHREGCPRDPGRMETYPKVREQDGIEVTVGHCLDCGGMAYRHGDAPPLSPPREPRTETLKSAESPPRRASHGSRRVEENKSRRPVLPSVPDPPDLPANYPEEDRRDLIRDLGVLATEGDELEGDPYAPSDKQSDTRHDRKEWTLKVRTALNAAGLPEHESYFFDIGEDTDWSDRPLSSMAWLVRGGETERKSERRREKRLARLRRIIAQLQERGDP